MAAAVDRKGRPLHFTGRSSFLGAGFIAIIVMSSAEEERAPGTAEW
jgi:hypothetical protein